MMAAAFVLVAGCGVAATGPAGPTINVGPPPPSQAVSGPNPTPFNANSPELTARPGTEIVSAHSEYGTMLFDGTGQPIYLFTAETGAQPACYGECAADWPPVLTADQPRTAGDARAGLLGTARRADGRTQVTYAGHPLYFYAHEGKYEVLCHNVVEYGGTWLAVRPDGSAVPAS